MNRPNALAKTLVAALPLAALLLGGCGATFAPMAAPKAVGHPAAKQIGTLRVAFAGLAAYKTLATSADVDHVRCTLSAGNQTQVRELGPKELHRPAVYADFASVPAGKASLEVLAYSQDGTQIGSGANGAVVPAGGTTQLHVSVKIDPNVGVGNVQAIVTFDDQPTPTPAPRDRAETFRQADVDGDGYLSLKEFLTTYHGPIFWGADDRKMPIDPPAMPIFCGPMPVDPAPGAAGTAIAFPGCNHGQAEFNRLDTNHDGRLSLDEFLADAPLPMPVPMPMVSAVPGPDTKL